jgi:predicted dehydrogenase
MSDHAATIRWAVIGVGRFGRIHARALAGIHGIEVAAICNRNAQKLEEAAAELGVATKYTDYRDLLSDASIDAVSITTHWQDHYEIALAALATGKHVLLEKPMGASTEECLGIVEAARAARGKFMVAHICRFDPRVTLAKQAIVEGRIGRVVSMHAKRNLPKAPGWLRLDKVSPLLGDGVHDADLMMWLSGRVPTRIYARYVRIGNFKYPELGWAMLEFGDETVGVVETNWGLPENTPTVIDARIEVMGTEGMLSIDCAATGLCVLDGNGLKMQDTDYWPEQHGRLVGAIHDELSYFAACIRNDEPPSVITPIEAARALSVMEAAEQSAVSGQVVDFVDPY